MAKREELVRKHPPKSSASHSSPNLNLSSSPIPNSDNPSNPTSPFVSFSLLWLTLFGLRSFKVGREKEQPVDAPSAADDLIQPASWIVGVRVPRRRVRSSPLFGFPHIYETVCLFWFCSANPNWLELLKK